ncbi:6735_t:CDS:2 [Entrophospora sp. SA101]|nr:6735_t:CDS:2 [Entrophospora sp. SA101]
MITSGIISNVGGFAIFGFSVRVFALALQNRPLLDRPITHVMSAVVFGGVGAYVYHLEQRQLELIEKRKQVLLENRKRREEFELVRRKGLQQH